MHFTAWWTVLRGRSQICISARLSWFGKICSWQFHHHQKQSAGDLFWTDIFILLNKLQYLRSQCLLAALLFLFYYFVSEDGINAISTNINLCTLNMCIYISVKLLKNIVSILFLCLRIEWNCMTSKMDFILPR
jgi:hypothetical protein